VLRLVKRSSGHDRVFGSLSRAGGGRCAPNSPAPTPSSNCTQRATRRGICQPGQTFCGDAAIGSISDPDTKGCPMRDRRLGAIMRTVSFLLAVPGLALGQPVQSPTRAEAAAALNPAPAAFSRAQIDQMLAPIALYPDELLLELLMASTFPQQVVDAWRWLQDGNNAALSGDDLAAALEPLEWDASVP
jgi:hypothetical protein